MKKGFVVSAVLYPLLVIALALIMSVIAMSDNRRKILDNLKTEVTEESESDPEMSNSTLYYKMISLEEAYAEMNSRLSEDRFEEIKTDYKNKINEAQKGSTLELHPVGSIYISMNSEDPASLFGGTWERISKGRALVGVDEDDTTFSTVNKEIGHKKTQAHTHTIKSHTHTVSGTTNNIGDHDHGIYMYTKAKDGSTRNTLGTSTTNSGTRNTTTTGAHSHTFSGSTSTVAETILSSGGGNSENIQPSLTSYMWKRVA